MEKFKIVGGEEYAFREVRGTKSPFQRIKVLEHLRHNKWKAEWIEPNPGLIDYVESAQIIVPWKERKPFLRDEENAAGLVERNKADGFQPKSPTTEAVQQVFESVGDEVDFYRHELFCSQEALARLRARADDQSGTEPLAGYIDRTGRAHWPFAPAPELARKFCATEPATAWNYLVYFKVLHCASMGTVPTQRRQSHVSGPEANWHVCFYMKVPLLNRY